MSRTYRRKKFSRPSTCPEWVLRERWMNPSEYEYAIAEYGDSIDMITHSSSWGHNTVDIWFKRNSKEGKRRLAEYRSDSASYKWHRPCGWWVAEFSQRPYRRRSKNELRKYMLDTEYEYMIESMPVLGYWN